MRAKQALLMSFWVISPGVFADGSSIGRIYQPYVQALEKELEYQLIVEDKNEELDTSIALHQFAVGASLSDDWFVEAALSYTDEPSYKLDSYELEVRRQLTEQGEYASDWGLALELEKEHGEDAWEVAIGVLNSLEWKRWQLTSNLFLIHEWGDDVKSEFETAFALQGLYRHSAALEPGFELFLGEDTRALGPMIAGQQRLFTTDKLFWQLSILFGSGDETPDKSLKLELEYEFY